MGQRARRVGGVGVGFVLLGLACGSPLPAAVSAEAPATPIVDSVPTEEPARATPTRDASTLGLQRAMMFMSPVPTSHESAAPSEKGAPEAVAEAGFDPAQCAGQASDLVLPSTAADDPRLQARRLLVADKGARTLSLFERGALTACWSIGLGFTPEGHKQVEGDGKTPIGWYSTSDKPWSSFAGAIAISYPSTGDADVAREDGRIGARTRKAIASANARGKMPPQRTALGGAILIHGGGSSTDWTAGCLALDDEDLASLRALLPKGKRSPILIIP